jgi:hypothetical protein
MAMQPKKPAEPAPVRNHVSVSFLDITLDGQSIGGGSYSRVEREDGTVEESRGGTLGDALAAAFGPKPKPAAGRVGNNGTAPPGGSPMSSPAPTAAKRRKGGPPVTGPQ